MRDAINLGGRLLLITLIAGLLLGLTDAVTREPIKAQVELEANEARQAVLPEAESFEAVDARQLDTPADEVFAGMAGGDIVGYTVKLASSGYGGDIVMTVGVKADGTIGGVRINSHSETPGLGAKAQEDAFIGQYSGKAADQPLNVVKTPAQDPGDIQAITGATITTRAVTDGVNQAVQLCKTLMEGGVTP